MSTHGDHAAMIGRLSVSAVEKSGEVFREASTALKLTQRLDKRSFFVVEDLDVEAVLCGERRFENDAEIVSRGARQDLKLLDKQVGGFRRDAKVPLVDRHVEVLGDGRSFLEVVRQSERVRLVRKVRAAQPRDELKRAVIGDVEPGETHQLAADGRDCDAASCSATSRRPHRRLRFRLQSLSSQRRRNTKPQASTSPPSRPPNASFARGRGAGRVNRWRRQFLRAPCTEGAGLCWASGGSASFADRGRPLLAPPRPAWELNETSLDDVLGVHPNPLDGLDPRRLVSLSPPVDLGLSVALPRLHMALLTCSEPQLDERAHATPNIGRCAAPSLAKFLVLARERLGRLSQAAADAADMLRLRSGVREHLSNLNALESHRVRTHRLRALNHLRRTASGLLGIEHNHRQPVASLVRTSPVAGNETRCLRDSRYDLVAQALFCGLGVTDVDPHDDCVHLAPPIKPGSRRSLRQPIALPPDVLLKQHRAKLLEPRGWIVEHGENRLALVNLEPENPRLILESAAEPVASRVALELVGDPFDELAANGDPGERMLVGGR
jgi:hypothetical protein